MSSVRIPSGVYTALATPFRKDFEVDHPALDKLIDHQLQGGVRGLVFIGSTGEAQTLNVTEKLAIVRKAVARIKGKAHIMAGAGLSDTVQTVELARLLEDAGADSLLVVTPPYNKPNQAGLRAHFQAIAAAVNIPICLYHVPSRSALKLSPENILELLEIPGVESVKEASQDINYFTKIKLKSKAQVFAGDDFCFLASLALGSQGVISVVTNLFPKAFVRLEEAFKSGEFARAQHIHETLFELMESLFIETNPCPLKWALEQKGLCQNYLRLPLAPIGSHSAQIVEQALLRCESKLKAFGDLC